MRQPLQPITLASSQLRCMNDLISGLALPAGWSDSEPSRMLETLVDALIGMLDLDFLYARVRLDSREAPIDALKTSRHSGTSHSQEEVRHALNQWSGEDPEQLPEIILMHSGEQDVSVFPIKMGPEGELGLIVAGSQRAGFPEQTERLLLGVAANQAAVGLQQARLLMEQKRVASELDRQVAQRTTELAAVNEELRKEIANRKHAGEDLRTSEEKYRVVVETASDAIVSIDDKGSIVFANPATATVFGYTPTELTGKPLPS